MTNFDSRYKSLNTNQKTAVDTIDGPVMVVAGPGTGKTELLSLRVANILKKTDASPQNILCMTFTDSGAAAMRERLSGLIGPDAYKVAIHTFHSFGSEIINHHGEYFYHGAHFRPADELSSYELLTDILETLPHDNPIASKMNDSFTHLSDIQSTISDFKKSGLTPDEVDAILDKNDAFCDWVRPHLQPAFAPTLRKSQLPHIETLLRQIADYPADDLKLFGYQPLHHVISESLRGAYDEAAADNSTKPLSAWKRTYLYKRSDGQQALKDEKRTVKLRATARVYYEYLLAMQKNELYDYDDMILRVVHAMEVFSELRFELQETYQYILVDEFQDTNDAQMRLIWNLTNNKAQNGRPNLMVVGDDDQAIYRFQGANISNVIDFTARYRDVNVITLTDNYRSGAPILKTARDVITQGEERLESILSLNKQLTPHRAGDSSVYLETYETEHESHYSLAQRIANDYAETPEATRSVIARNHRQLLALLPYLQASGVPLRYERQDNALDSEPIMQLELLARVIDSIAVQDFDETNSLLPELLSHPAWGLPARTLWEISLSAYKNRVFWLEEMLAADGQLREIAEWLIVCSHVSQHEPLEQILDRLIGIADIQTSDTEHADTEDTAIVYEGFSSPLRAYFFPSYGLDTKPGQYLGWLSALQTIRKALREFRSDKIIKLRDFVEFVDLHREMGLRIQTSGSVEHDASAVTLLTAHKSKGLEFDTVYIVDAHENIWGSSARSRSRLIQFPSNLPLAPAGDGDDERLRLLYVALTRAKSTLGLFCARRDLNGKDIVPVGALTATTITPYNHGRLEAAQLVAAIEQDWRQTLMDVDIATKEQLLRPVLERYKLSATHLNNFLDVTKGGPQLFLIHNLLRFPQAMSPSAAYGSAIHKSLQRAHTHLSATSKRRPVEDVLHDFEEYLRESHLSEEVFAAQLQRGSAALTVFLSHSYEGFHPSQLVERDFRSETIVVDEARLTGAIDLIDIDHDEKTIFITDYKTGKPVRSWKGRTEYERIKLHHYEQQLLFYKLLVENSRQFSGYRVSGARLQFVEPDENGEILHLDYRYDATKESDFRRLVAGVWSMIISQSFDAPSEVTALKDIIAYENSIVNNDFL